MRTNWAFSVILSAVFILGSCTAVFAADNPEAPFTMEWGKEKEKNAPQNKKPVTPLPAKVVEKKGASEWDQDEPFKRSLVSASFMIRSNAGFAVGYEIDFNRTFGLEFKFGMTFGTNSYDFYPQGGPVLYFNDIFGVTLGVGYSWTQSFLFFAPAVKVNLGPIGLSAGLIFGLKDPIGLFLGTGYRF